MREGLVERVSEVVASRRAGLESARAAAEAHASTPAPAGLLQRIKKYLSL